MENTNANYNQYQNFRTQQPCCPPQLPHWSIQPPSIPLPVLIHQMEQLRSVSVENVLLRSRLVEKNLSEAANTEVFKSWDKKIFTCGRNGIPRLLLNHAITHAEHIIPQPPSRQEPFLFIVLDTVGTPLIISEADFFQDSRLILALQELPGVEITPRRTQKQTAMLLRQAIGDELTTVYLPSYAGWTRSQDGAFQFSAFPDFSTHRKRDQYALPAAIQAVSNSETIVAAQQFWPIFGVIRNLFDRHLLVLWYHLSTLSSLLDHLGYHVPLALNCFVPGTNQQRYLKQLFGWFGDAPLSLDLRPAEFLDGLTDRRDQPLVIEDVRRLDHAAANVRMLETVLAAGTAPWRSGKGVQPLPVQAPVTIISSGVSNLNCSPLVCNLELFSDFFDRDLWLSLTASPHDNHDYICAFVSYTAAHIAELQGSLAQGMQQAQREFQNELTEECLDMYGIFIGLSAFLTDFFRFCSPVTPPISDMLDATLLAGLAERLARTSEAEQLADLADIFLSVARQQIQHGILTVCHQKAYTPGMDNMVVCNDQYFHFTSNAFRRVCDSLQQSYPVILNTLASAGLLCGKQSNRQTAQTRISVWEECDNPATRRTVAGYSIDREAFDLLGDPLIFDWEA